MTSATTCEVCGSPVTQNEHGETWHIARPMTVAEAAKVLLEEFELKVGPWKKSFFETGIAQHNLRALAEKES